MTKGEKEKSKPTVFEFVSYKFEPGKKRIFFNYKQEFLGRAPIFFTETIILPKKVSVVDLNEIPQGLLDKIFQGLHLILGISYYKLYCATKIKINYSLPKEEVDFWNTVYKKGLGEFFYKNKLNPKNCPKFAFDKTLRQAQGGVFNLEKNNKFFVAISGGKDSIVAAELLKERGIDITAVFTETQKGSLLVDKIIEISGLNSLKIRRQLDEKIFNKNAGYFQGHIPISAIYGFLAVLCCVLYKKTYFVMANEHSSNFGNTEYKGQTINHQWSKSFEFENLFQNYVRDFITPDIYYFSLLRPFYEIRIAEMFSKYKKYFPYFSSCNKNFKIASSDTLSLRSWRQGLWCGECPKCVFVFILLSAFLSKKELLNIFKKNLYQDENLLPIFKDVLGFGKMKPFDCVGTFEESRAALYLAKEKFGNTFVVKELLPKIKNPERLIEKVFKTQDSLVPDHLKFLGMKNAAILGYGKEGEITEKYLRKNFPKLKVDILDQKFDKNYLKKQKNYDILIKTPGIAKNKIKIQYTTATNIFFSEIKGRGNKIIGVTGSKGKSTTTSLIYEILKTAGKNVEILGNIGKPMLEALLKPIQKDKIFVLELSSAQLEDLDFSPNIAIITNLFPEHMDYHGNEENYYKAKKNIINFQNSSDFFVFNPKDKKLINWSKGARARIIPFVNANNFQSNLLGEHNKKNIGAAVAVARLFDVPEKIIKKAVKNFKPLEHRLEFVGEFREIKFYDDAISTTPESTIMAIKTLKNIDTIFLGGQDRGYDFSQLEKTIKKYKIKNIVLFPESGNRILKQILQRGSGQAKNFNILRTRDMGKAVSFAYKNTRKGRICLLSCASPSYSLWKNFEEKGNQFKFFVRG